MSLTLLLMRHAKSDWSNDSLTDHERPLNQRGQKAAPLMGRHLALRRLVPDLLITSNAVRATQTAALVAEACGYAGKIVERSNLYLAPPKTYLELLRDIPSTAQRVMMIGHNPGLSDLASQLTAHECSMPTGAVCQIEFAAASFVQLSNPPSGRWIGLFTPKEL